MNETTWNIAVVDDDDSVRRALGRLLRAAGFQASSYSSAEQFLADAPRVRTDCLVLDIHLGGMSGLDLQRQLVAANASPPVIFITAAEDSETPERARRAGCVAFFQKPVPGKSLLAAVRNAVEGGGAAT